MKHSINYLRLYGIEEYTNDTNPKPSSAYNPNRPAKNWLDKSIGMRGGSNNIQYWTLARNENGYLLDSKGEPYMELFTVPRTVAADELNILPQHSLFGNVEIYPTPLRQLRAGERLVMGFNGPMVDDGVEDKATIEANQGPGATINFSDRKLLEQIYYKVLQLLETIVGDGAAQTPKTK